MESTRRRDGATMAVILMLAVVVAYVAGCAYDVAEAESDEEHEQVAAAAEEITRGTETTTPRWVVEISADGSYCSGSVLSENWILTAAHCLDAGSTDRMMVTIAPTAGTRQKIYDGPAQYFVHPDYPGAGNAHHDAGLVYLSGHGLDLSLTGRAKLFTDSRKPWRDPRISDDFVVTGWGLGSSAGGTTDCDSGVGQVKRMGVGFDMHVTTDDNYVTAGIEDVHPCGGDSGAPWLLLRGSLTEGFDYMVFAIHSGRRWTWFSTKNEAALLEDNIAWIKATMRDAVDDPYGNVCWTRSLGSYVYEECEEYGRGSSDLRGLGGKCMEASGATNGSAVRLNVCNTANSRQQWSLLPSGEIRSLAASGMCLSVRSGSTANRTPMEIATCNGTLRQRFGYEEGGEIPSALSWDKCVEVQGGFTANGTPIQLYDCNGTASQWWTW